MKVYFCNLLFVQLWMPCWHITCDPSDGDVFPCSAHNCEQTTHNMKKFSVFCINWLPPSSEPDAGWWTWWHKVFCVRMHTHTHTHTRHTDKHDQLSNPDLHVFNPLLRSPVQTHVLSLNTSHFYILRYNVLTVTLWNHCVSLQHSPLP